MNDRDTADLCQFGYAQQLRRSLGSFSSFAVAFSLISVFTGVSANFGHGLRQVGGCLVWSWLIVLAGQMLVALLLAELSTRIPLSGYGYQWTSRLVNPHFGFFVGWLLTLQFLTGFPGVCATLAAQVGHWVGGAWASPSALTVLTLAVIALTALVHLLGIRLASHVNNTGVWTELLGVFGLSLALIVLALNRGSSPLIV
jgi:amino acid transporter